MYSEEHIIYAVYAITSYMQSIDFLA